MIEFPDAETARSWYSSDGYQEIVDFQIRNTVGGAFIVEGVDADYRAASLVTTTSA